MPKRDEAYMQAQRDAIARAALALFLEKGAYTISLRDICAAAGISIGALYIHFANREEVIAAACVVAWRDNPMPPVETWAQYRDYLVDDVAAIRLEQNAGINRLALQLVAELPQMDESSQGLAEVMRDYRDWFLQALTGLERSGEASLPLGLGPTAEIHMQIVYGAYYQSIIDRDMPAKVGIDAMLLALATTAGVKERD